MPQTSDQGIIRVIKQKDFTAISRHALQDSRLSFTARGVLGYLLSKPDDWIVRNVDLQREGRIGRDKVEKILKELQDYGYLHRTRVRLPNGRWDWTSTVYEEPCPENTGMEPCPDLPSTVNTGIYKKQNIGAVAVATDAPPNSLEGASAPQVNAVSVYAEIAEIDPARITTTNRKLIETTVIDLGLWSDTVMEWVGSGYNRANIIGMLDRYGKGKQIRAARQRIGVVANYSNPSDEALSKFIGGA